MKLYFYFLETGKIRFEECDVIEKPKTYSPVNKFPAGYTGCYVKKEDIGKLIGYYENILVLEERDTRKAADVFRDRIRDRINRENRSIELSNISIKKCNETLTMIDEWEKDTEKFGAVE